jgi:type I restriction enzyme S subunit
MAEVKEMEKLPEGWKRVRLGEVCNLSYGKNLTINRFKDDGQYKVYGANGVIGYYDQYTHEEEVVLVSCRGEYSGVINISEPKSYITNNSIPLVIKDPNQLQTNSLYYCLKLLPKNNFVSGSAQPQVVINDLKLVKITFPEALPEQRKIVEILETVDSAIEKTDKIIEKYKRIKQGLTQDLLTKGIDENGQIRNEETHRFKDSPLGRIPKDWEVLELGEVFKLKSGMTRPCDTSEFGNYPVYGGNGILGYTNEKNFNIETIIIGRVGEYCGSVYIASGGWVTDNALYVAVKKRVYNNLFLCYLLNYINLNQYSAETGQPLMTQSIVYRIQIPLPPLPEQHRIVSILSQIDETIEKEQRYKEKLERIKQGLMEDLLTGKVRVNHLIEGVENVSQT